MMPTISEPKSALTTCCAGYVIGRPVINSCSLRKAMMLPENEIAPIAVESTIVWSGRREAAPARWR